MAALLGASNGNADLEGSWGNHLDRSSSVQAVMDLFGPTDFERLLDHGAADSPEGQLLGRAIREEPDRVRRTRACSHYGCV